MLWYNIQWKSWIRDNPLYRSVIDPWWLSYFVYILVVFSVDVYDTIPFLWWGLYPEATIHELELGLVGY